RGGGSHAEGGGWCERMKMPGRRWRGRRPVAPLSDVPVCRWAIGRRGENECAAVAVVVEQAAAETACVSLQRDPAASGALRFGVADVGGGKRRPARLQLDADRLPFEMRCL